jgi:oligopeptide transport system substrate-binding protein
LKNLRMRSRGALIAGLMLIALALVLAACGSSSNNSGSATSGGTPVEGGTYNFALFAEPISIEPLNTQESEGAQVEHQCFQGLYKIVQQGDSVTTVPDLADGPAVPNADATVFTVKIKHGIMFGPPVNREVTAQDFVDSWNYNADPANKSATTYIMAPIQGIDPNTLYVGKGGLTGVKALDKYTLQIKLRYPFAEFPATLVHPVLQVFPVDYAKQVGRQAYFNHPVGGTGPYMVKSWVHNQSVTLVKNPNYWDKAGAGYVDTINMPIIQTDTTAYLDFQKGTIDYSTVPSGQWRATLNSPNVKSGKWTAKAYPSTSVYFISINMSKSLGAASMLPIRQALNYGADRVAVCNVVREGIPIPDDEFIPVTIAGYQPGLNPYPYDPAKGTAAVSAWKSANGGQNPPEIPYWYNSGTYHGDVAQALTAGWDKLGLTFKLSGILTNSYWTELGENKGPGIYRVGWIEDYPSIDNFVYLFTTAGGKYGSYSYYSNKKVDQTFQQARATIDQTQRFALYNQAVKMALTDAPCVPIYTYRDARVTNNRIGGFNYDAAGFVDMNKVWVRSSQ